MSDSAEMSSADRKPQTGAANTAGDGGKMAQAGQIAMHNAVGGNAHVGIRFGINFGDRNGR